MGRLLFSPASMCCLALSCCSVDAVSAADDKHPVGRADGGLDLSEAVVTVLGDETVLRNAARMLIDAIGERTRILLSWRVGLPAEASGSVVLVIGTLEQAAKYGIALPGDIALPQREDAYALWVRRDDMGAVTYMIGFDKRGALYAVGRLLRELEMGRDRVALDHGLRLASAPDYPLRGHQMGYRPKTNSYDAWDLTLWERYYRDMIVFGCNAVELVPPVTDDDVDSPHFPRPPMEMMVAMSQLAEDYDLDVWIWYPVMEFYVEKGEEITDDLIELSIRNREDVLSKLPRVDAVFVPSGDPGEIHPRHLFPHLKGHKRILTKYHPKATIWSSVQNYDDEEKTMGWTHAFYDRLVSGRADGLDGVVFGPATETTLRAMREAVPERFPIRRYPDITHSKQSQFEVPGWDPAWKNTAHREPINPRPVAHAKIFRDTSHLSIGFITYSEGCNDDLNKVTWSCLGWDCDRPIEEIVEEYSRYFIGPRLGARCYRAE